MHDYNDIPDDILDKIKSSFDIDLRKNTIMKGIKLDDIPKKSIIDIGRIIGDSFNEERKKEDFNYSNYYSLCKCIIKYIPKDNNREYQLRLYNLVKIFDKNIGKYEEIKSYDILYSDVNKGIIQYINESIQNCLTIMQLNKIYSGDGYKLIDDNKDILYPDKYDIIPNQNGNLKKLTDLKRDVKICGELIEILDKYKSIKSILIDNKIKNFQPTKILTNDDLKQIINEIIENYDKKIKDYDKKIKEYEKELKECKYYEEEDYSKEIDNISELKTDCEYKYDLFIKDILSLIPEENIEKQKEIKFLYESLCIKIKYKNKVKKKNENSFEISHKKNEPDEILNEKEEKILKLDSSFWNAINKKALEKCLKFFEKGNNLKDIDPNEDKAFEILDKFYKHVQPQMNENEELEIVPNQNGNFCKYKDLYNEKDINPNFKKMLKNYFSYDISKFLIHSKLKNIKVQKELCINDDMISIIKQSFYKTLNENEQNNYEVQYKTYLKKSKQLFHFYPKNENEDDDDNMVKKFIKYYKVITGEKFEEEEIKTINITLWDKAIKILLIDILKIIDEDKHIAGTLKRLKMTEENEGEIIKNLNGFYSILFQTLREEKEKKIIDDFMFVPNERKEYKKLDGVYINKDIDDEIKNIYSYLDKKNYFKTILIPKSINLTVKHQEKCLQDIALIIDREIKNKYVKIDALIETRAKEVKIDENLKKACAKLITEWFAKHKKERKEFEFVNSHIPEISMKIIHEGKYKDYTDDIFIYGSMFNLCSYAEEITPKNKINNNNSNNNYNENNNNNKNYQSHNTYQKTSSYNYNDYKEKESLNSSYSSESISFINITQNNIFNNNNVHTIPESLKKYYLAQAYVFEDLNNSKLFKEINWNNKVNNNEEGEEITLINNNKYKIKNSDNLFDFTITSNNNKSTNIIVQVLNEKRYNYIKLKCTVNQWNLFNNEGNEQSTSIFALVRFHSYNTPEIFYVKKSNLNEII